MSRSNEERNRERYANNSERQYQQRLQQMRGGLWSRLSDIFLTLAVDEAGAILFNTRNLSKVNEIGMQIQGYTRSSGFGLVNWIFTRLQSLFGINRNYFGTMTSVPATVDQRVLQLTMARYGYDVQRNRIDPNGYIASNVNGIGQAQAVAQRLNQAIAGRMSLRDFIRSFRADFNSPGSPLSVDYHFNRFARDVFQEFDRTVQRTYADELGLDHAVYGGTVKDNTRDFCERRNNRIYTREEIDKWNAQNWKGKKPGVDVTIALGGYNCRHILSWITAETAEQLSARRELEINTYNTI